MKKKRKNKVPNKIIKVIAYLIALIIVFILAPNYEKNDNYYIEDKINLIIDNNNVTKNLKHDLFITDKKVIYMSIQDVLSGAVQKDGVYYVPITAMGKIYEVDIEHIKDEQILLLDSLTKKLIKADVSKDCSVKYKTTAYSRTVDKLEKADKVIVIEHLENNWTKIRTKKGRIGYIKTKILQNEMRVREDIKTKVEI